MLKSMIELRIDPQTLNKLAKIWPHPETGTPGVTPYFISKQAGVNEQTIRNYMDSDDDDFNPRWHQVRKLESFFGGIIVFCVDDKRTIDNDKRLETLEGFLKNYFYKKPSK